MNLGVKLGTSHHFLLHSANAIPSPLMPRCVGLYACWNLGIVFAIMSLSVFVVCGVMELRHPDSEGKDTSVVVTLVVIGIIGLSFFTSLLFTAVRRTSCSCFAVHSEVCDV